MPVKIHDASRCIQKAPNLKVTKSTEFPPNFAEFVLNVQKEYQIYGFSWGTLKRIRKNKNKIVVGDRD